jgi:hypothetical protein
MKYIIPIFILIFILAPMVVQAQGAVDKLLNLLDYIGLVLYWIGAAIALIVVLISGIQYMTAGGNEEKATKAKKTLIYGLIGAAIIAASGFILNLIEDILHKANIM